MAKAIIVEGVRHARTLVLARTAAVESGDVVVSSGNVLVAVSNMDADEKSSFVYRGRIAFPKGTGAVASGAAVYWDESAGQAMCPGNNESAGKIRSGRTRKGGKTTQKGLGFPGPAGPQSYAYTRSLKPRQ